MLETTETSSVITSFTSYNLFFSIPRFFSFNGKKPFPIPVPKPECTVAYLTFFPATQVGAIISSLGLSRYTLLRISPLFKDMVIVLITCEFPTPVPPVRNM